MISRWKFVVIPIALALGICALGWWNMSVAELLLRYIGVVLTWPPVVALIFLYFIGSQREAIAKLIDRIAEIVFPGGSLKLPPYDGIEAQSQGGPDTKKPSAQESVSTKEETEAFEPTDKAFQVLIVRGISSNQAIIAQLLDRLWIKFRYPLFKTGNPPERYLDKVQAMEGVLNQNVTNDLNRIEKATRGDEKKGITDLAYVYLTSQKLVWYLSDTATRNQAYREKV